MYSKYFQCIEKLQKFMDHFSNVIIHISLRFKTIIKYINNNILLLIIHYPVSRLITYICIQQTNVYHLFLMATLRQYNVIVYSQNEWQEKCFIIHYHKIVQQQTAINYLGYKLVELFYRHCVVLQNIYLTLCIHILKPNI